LEVIDLVNDGSGLGFGIIGGKSTGVVVKTIVPGGMADQVRSFLYKSHLFPFLGLCGPNHGKLNAQPTQGKML
jgi:hypothetical protein